MRRARRTVLCSSEPFLHLAVYLVVNGSGKKYQDISEHLQRSKRESYPNQSTAHQGRLLRVEHYGHALPWRTTVRSSFRI